LIPRFRFADGYGISRIIKGSWHLAGDHGPIDPAQARADMARFVEAGVTTFDCADIYTGVETMIGDFRRAYPSLAAGVQIHTKFVPDLADLATLDRAAVERTIDRSLMRLGVERLDLVQFHWWDFATPRYVETALELERLRVAGKIAHVGVTNFDVPRLGELLAAGVRVLTNQVQYSLIDDRPRLAMVDLCRDHGIGLLCYGTLAGGLLSEAWVGAPPPDRPSNRSLVKYALMVEEFGGWAHFQDLLAVLDTVAKQRGADIGSIAARVILGRPQVAGVIIGATSARHLARHAALAGIVLDDDDMTAIDAVLARRLGPVGDVYGLERDRAGPHGSIMKYQLNSIAG
jgi:aryl-alcohol dehydrogenase-like predicted oxidoreductase